MLKKIVFALFITVETAADAGAFSYNHDYRHVTADLDVSGTDVIAVATHDKRRCVAAKQTGPDYIGVLQTWYAHPAQITTVSRLPLSEDMTSALKVSLSKKGFKPVSVPTSPFEKIGVVLQRMKETEAERLVLLTINSWRSDTDKRTRFIYDVSLSIFDRYGQLLGGSSAKADLNLLKQPGATGDKNGRQEFKRIIEKMFNDPSVVKALTADSNGVLSLPVRELQ